MKAEMFFIRTSEQPIRKDLWKISLVYDNCSVGFICTKWKNIEISIMEKWTIKIAKFAAMAKLICLIRDKKRVL